LLEKKSESPCKKSKKMIGLKIDAEYANSKCEENSFTFDLSESPYLSALNLPPIAEEDMESEHGRVFKFGKEVLATLEDEESPF
jgi:hypothetical protein